MIRGTSEVVAEEIARLAKQHRLVYTSQGWQAEGDKDLLWERDPWDAWQGEKGKEASKTSGAAQKTYQLKSVFTDVQGHQLKVQCYDELMKAKGPWSGVVFVTREQVEEALRQAAAVAGTIILISKAKILAPMPGAVHKQMQLIAKDEKTEDWRAGLWSTYTFADNPVELAVEGVRLEMATPQVARLGFRDARAVRWCAGAHGLHAKHGLSPVPDPEGDLHRGSKPLLGRDAMESCEEVGHSAS